MDFAALKTRIAIEDALPFLGLTLKRSTNGQLRGKCPACESDNDRALVVTPGRGAYCFNEKRGGDVIWLVSHVRGIGVRQAAQELAAHFGLEERPVPQEPARAPTPSEKATPSAERPTFGPLTYLDHAQAFGLDAETATALGIGYAPKGLMRGTVAVPIRTDTGKLVGYIGIPADTAVKLPTKFHL